MTYRGIWRDPATESDDLYPGLVVHDGRVTGSITSGPTRLPLWAFVTDIIHRGWGDVEDDYPSAAEIGADGLAAFLYDLLEARGEFGRLLLVVAGAERAEQNRENDAWEAHVADAHADDRDEVFCECGHRDPPPWWDDDELKAPVVEQLRRCLRALDA